MVSQKLHLVSFNFAVAAPQKLRLNPQFLQDLHGRGTPNYLRDHHIKELENLRRESKIWGESGKMSAGKGREKINQVAGFKEGRAKKDDSI